MSETYIIIRDQFPALHSWPECPHEEVAFLRNPHRHMFHVEVKLVVDHNDRAIEFFMFKRVLSQVLLDLYANRDLGSKSCEMLCNDLRHVIFYNYPEKVTIKSISVFEDGENGAEVVFL